MATTDTTSLAKSRGFALHRAQILGLVALLAPLSYFAGRLSMGFLAHTYVGFIASGAAAGSLGVMIGIPVGLFFGSFRRQVAPAVTSPNTLEMERAILTQLRDELIEDKALFEARRGSTTMFARIEYLTSFWTSIKASGRLFVMQDASLLGSIGAAYFWLDQATHLETLAYEAKYTNDPASGPAVAERLINEARLLDGQLESSMTNALAALDTALAA
jgi:hypothetical protein